MSNAGMGITSHLLGNRHYELTNHLGNVQATVVDRVSPTLRSSDSALLGYRADISTAQDYYPFGMLMPGRYISDTGKKCVTFNTTVLVPVYTKVYPTATMAPATQQSGSGNTTPIHKLPKPTSAVANAPYIYHYNAASTHPNNTVISGALVNNMSQWSISLSDEPSGGVSAFMHIQADTNLEAQEVGFELDLPENVYAELCVRQYVDTGEEYTNVVAWTTINTSGAQSFMVPINKAYVQAGGPTILQMTFRTIGNVNLGTGTATQWKNYYTYLSHYVSQTHIATICEEKDNYRFGFNGQEKDNEAKGIGNSLDFGARIYDSRLGKFLSIDKYTIKYPAHTPYNFVVNNPICATDPDGNLVMFIGGLRLWVGQGDQHGYAGGKNSHQGIYNYDATKYWSTDKGEKNAFGRSSSIDNYFMNKIGDHNAWYTSGSSSWQSDPKWRMNQGAQKAKEFHAMVQSGKIKLENGETIKVVSHSQGGAHSVGFVNQLLSYKDKNGKPLYNIEVMYYITPHQPGKFSHLSGIRGVQYSHPKDAISSDDPVWLPNGGSDYGKIKGITEFHGGDIMGGEGQPPAEGPMGNRSGHNVTDNDQFINNGSVKPRQDTPTPAN